MALPKIKNMVGMTVSGTPGTGTITLLAAYADATTTYRSFATAYGANANVDVTIVEDGLGQEECRDCTYTHSGTTLTRGTLESSSTGSRISFTSAAKVFVTNLAYRIHNLNNPGVVRVTGDGSTVQSIPSATYTKITTALATEVTDPRSWWDHTNKKFIPDVAGTYFINCALGIGPIADGGFCICAAYKNGAIYAVLGKSYCGVAATYFNTGGSAVVELNGTTDYIEIYIYQSDASSQNTLPGADRTFFNAHRLGE